jgi:hypothetical protein
MLLRGGQNDAKASSSHARSRSNTGQLILVELLRTSGRARLPNTDSIRRVRPAAGQVGAGVDADAVRRAPH